MAEKSIKVTIAGRIYPITVKGDEEERVRSAAKEIDDNIKFLQQNYAVKDKQDLLAMTALELSTKSPDAGGAKAPIIDSSALDRIEAAIDKII